MDRNYCSISLRISMCAFNNNIKCSLIEFKGNIIEFSDGVRADYAERDLEIIDLAYAMTIHKSQGTECSTVIIPIMMSHYIMLKRNLIYTAITRATEKVYLVNFKDELFAE